ASAPPASALHEALELLRAARVTELAERLGFDLADALAGHLEVLADLFERVIALFADAEAHAQDLLLARGQRLQHLPRLLAQVHVDDGVGGADHALVFDEVAEVAVLFLADRRLEADRLLGDLEDLAHLVERQLHLLGDLFRRRLPSELLHEVTGGTDELVDRLDHVHGDADRAGLIGDRARDGLPNPPRRVGAELVAALVLELVHGLHQADVAFLDQVQKLQAAVRVLLGDRHDEAQVRLHELGLGALGLALAGADRLVRLEELAHVDAQLLLDLLHALRGVAQRLVHDVELAGGDAELARELVLRDRVVLGVPQHAPELGLAGPRQLLELDDLALHPVDALDHALELRDDLVDRLLVQAHFLQRLHEIALLLRELLVDELAARFGGTPALL